MRAKLQVIVMLSILSLGTTSRAELSDWDLKMVYDNQLLRIFSPSLKSRFDVPSDINIPSRQANPAFHAATTKFGSTVIDMSSLPYRSPILDSGMQAWSSWWFPKRDNDFTTPKKEGELSILEKFDLVNGIVKGASNSAFAVDKKNDDARHADWEGLCDAWALASILYPEPVKATTITILQRSSVAKPTPTPKPRHSDDDDEDHKSNNKKKTEPEPSKKPAEKQITFAPWELKGLVMRTFENVGEDQLDIYGEKFQATADAYTHPDLYPDQFHRLIEIYLGIRKQPILMDRDPGVEVWSVPIYKANFTMEAVPNYPNAVFVRMYLYTAASTQTDDREHEGTIEVVRQYNYILSGDLDYTGTKLTIKKGAWLKTASVDSRVNHPDFMFAPKMATVKRASFNPFILPVKVDALLKRGGNAVPTPTPTPTPIPTPKPTPLPTPKLQPTAPAIKPQAHPSPKPAVVINVIKPTVKPSQTPTPTTIPKASPTPARSTGATSSKSSPTPTPKPMPSAAPKLRPTATPGRH